MLGDLKNFLLRGNIIDLAVAFILGLTFNAIVQAFANDFLLGLVGALFGQPDFSTLSFTINGEQVVYGTTIDALLNFVLIGTSLFFIIRALSRMVPPAPQDAATPPSDEVVVLTEIRDALVAQGRR